MKNLIWRYRGDSREDVMKQAINFHIGCDTAFTSSKHLKDWWASARNALEEVEISGGIIWVGLWSDQWTAYRISDPLVEALLLSNGGVP